MPKLTYPVTQAGLEVSVLIGLDGQDTTDLITAGQPVPAPILLRGVLDTGSTVTAVAPWVFQRLGLVSKARGSSQTAAGQTSVQLFRISIAILPLAQQAGLPFTLSSVWGSDLTVTLPDADVLVGLNVLLECKFTLDGSTRTFSLDF